MTDFERHLLCEIRDLRERLAEACPECSDFIFEIRAQGRVLDGDLKVEFRLERRYDSEVNVSGGSLDSVEDEFIRRHLWRSRNAALCLPKVGAPKSDEIPF